MVLGIALLMQIRHIYELQSLNEIQQMRNLPCKHLWLILFKMLVLIIYCLNDMRIEIYSKKKEEKSSLSKRIFFLFSKQTCIFVCTCFLRKPERSLIYIRLILSRSVVCLCTEITRIMRMFLCSNQPWVDVIGSSMPNNWAETSLH